MIRRLPILLLAVAAIASAPLARANSSVHFELRTSSPEDESTFTAVDTIRLEFTQVPQDDATTVRLLNGSGELVETEALHQDEEDGKIFHLPVGDGLADGAWTVSWRSMASDGHVVRGDFAFTVAAER